MKITHEKETDEQIVAALQGVLLVLSDIANHLKNIDFNTRK